MSPGVGFPQVAPTMATLSDLFPYKCPHCRSSLPDRDWQITFEVQTDARALISHIPDECPACGFNLLESKKEFLRQAAAKRLAAVEVHKAEKEYYKGLTFSEKIKYSHRKRPCAYFCCLIPLIGLAVAFVGVLLVEGYLDFLF